MEEEKEHSNSNEIGPVEILVGIFVLFFVFSLIFQGIGSKLQSAEEGTALGDLQFLSNKIKNIWGSPYRPLSPGQEVRSFKASILYDVPGGAIRKGIGEGAQGIITAGPAEHSGNTWWQVQYSDGLSGWVVGDVLVSLDGGEVYEEGPERATGPLGKAYDSFRFVSTGVSLLLLVGIAYCVIRVFQIRRDENERLMEGTTFFGVPHDSIGQIQEAEPPGRTRWEMVQKHINSESENDWRLAILEADVLLDELSKDAGWFGENLGERLKGLNQGDFLSLDKAWEAHKMRNTIAHEGANFALSQREARRVIGLFEEVFKEFNYI